MSEPEPASIPNPWPLIQRIAYRAQAIAKLTPAPHAAVIYQRHIQIIPRHAIFVGCTVLWTWTKTEILRGLTFQAMTDLESRFTAALLTDLDSPPNITCPTHPQMQPLDPQELIV